MQIDMEKPYQNMENKAPKRELFQLILKIMLCVTVLFIWGHSCLNKADSASESAWVVELIQRLVDGLKLHVTVSQHFVRKLAHFLEHALLGAELTVWCIGVKGYTSVRELCLHIWKAWIIVWGVGFMDETIQIFSNRGSAVADVWLDLFGGVCGSLAVMLLYGLMVLKKRRN